MAASTRRMNEFWRRATLALVLCTLLLHNGVCQEPTDSPATDVTPSPDGQAPTDPDIVATNPTDVPTNGGAAASRDTAGTQSTSATDTPAGVTVAAAVAETNSTATVVPAVADDDASSQTTEQATATPPPSRGDASRVITAGPTNQDVAGTAYTAVTPQVVEVTHTTEVTTVAAAVRLNVVCVDKEAVKDRDAVKIKLSTSSSCINTKALIESKSNQVCGKHATCNLEIFQEDNSNNVIVTGQEVEGDAKGMAEKFKELGLEDAMPQWGRHPPTVLVSLLLTGLLLAALLIGGYYWKNHRCHRAKGMRLAEDSYPADEENQGNTLVSVAPLHPPEPQEKPSANGESQTPTPPPATTNGHSTTKAPVADTEL